jgi:hypothetical protein
MKRIITNTKEMKKLLLYLWIILTTVCTGSLVYAYTPNGKANNTEKTQEIDEYIKTIYRQINFCQSGRLRYEVFRKAYYGYINLYNSGKLNPDKDILTICDFTMSSSEYRLWVIDLRLKKALIHTYVTHGMASGEEYAKMFSNGYNSHKSSIGFFVTGDTYVGDCGVSLRLHGMDNGFNDAAYDRGIVLHGSRFANGKYIADKKMLGRSLGCPAVPFESLMDIIFSIEKGTCLFIYYPQEEYIQSAYWLNKMWDNLPNNTQYSSQTINTLLGNG